MGRVLTKDALGFYGLALMMATFPFQVFGRLSSVVLFPVLTRLRDRPREEMRRAVLKLRVILLLVFLPMQCVLVIWGELLVRVMYDHRYAASGWMTQVLACGLLVRMIPMVGPIHLAHGESWYALVRAAGEAALNVGAMVVGFLIGGTSGVVWGAAVGNALSYFIVSSINARYGVALRALDAVALAASAIVVGGGLALNVLLRQWGRI
jgi:O-antigen/teichoic acid export membrane protein